MTAKASQEVILRSTGILVGKTSDAYNDLQKALQTGADADWLAAQTSFNQLAPEMRARIRLHAESYARLIADDQPKSNSA
jgi:hypothetical protein